VPRPLPELQKILDDAYGTENRQDARNYVPGLAGIALSLSKGDLPLAMIGGVMLKLPEIAHATFTAKFDPSQPRDQDGRWTDGAGSEAKETPPIGFEGEQSPSLVDLEAEAASGSGRVSLEAIAPRVIGLLGRFAGVLSGPLALAAGLLIPTNRSNIHFGDIPDFPGLTFRSDEGVVTLSRRDANGNVEDLFHGVPDTDGFYNDDKGEIIGRHVGTGVLFDNDYLADLGAKPAKTPTSGSDTGPALDASPALAPEDDEPKVCPPPTPESIAGRSSRSLAYQNQITGLPIGWDVLYRGVRFDGCNNTTQFMQEAKGLMAEYLTKMSDDKLRRSKFYRDIMKQAGNQNAAAVGRGVDWYFADQKFTDFFLGEFERAEYSNITVHHEEAITKKIEDCMALVRIHRDAWRVTQSRQPILRWPSIDLKGACI
jgi:hypothetical protein